jgi:hypothetical protein
MKITHGNPGAPADPTVPMAGATATPTDPAAPVLPATDDQLTLSPDLQLLQQASGSALAATGIRTELVEQMKQLLATKGPADPAALADAIIDEWLRGV